MDATYGAKGDCVTDDGPAIQAALNAAVPKGQAVIFPKPMGGCYLVSTLHPTGAAMIGQAGSGDTSRNFTVMIKGKPGYDIIEMPDPSDATPTYFGGWSIENITFEVNGSVAVSTSTVPNYVHRWPGRWIDDGAMTAGSNTIASQNAKFSCGDIGQPIQVNGAGANGTNLVTTIASVAPCWTYGYDTTDPSNNWQVVKLAASAQTTVSNAHTYVSVLGLPVTQNIPNCAIAFDNRDGNPANWPTPNWSFMGNMYNFMKNVNIIDVGGGSVCGIYFQGGWGPYGLRVQDFTYRGLQFAVVQGTSEFNSWYQSSSNDYQKWDHGSIMSVWYPWISYNGGERVIEDVELTANAGPQFLNSGNKWADATGAGRIIIPEFENYLNPTIYGFRDEGGSDYLNVTFTENPTGAGYIGGNDNVCTNCGGNVNVGGNNNYLANGLQATINDWGRGNWITGNYAASILDSLPAAYDAALSPIKGTSKLVGNFSGDNFMDGNNKTLYNHKALII